MRSTEAEGLVATGAAGSRRMRPIRTTDLPCTGCGAREDCFLFAGREHEYDDTTDEEFRVVRCGRCGLVRLNPRPDVSELEQIYPPNYYAYNLVSEDDRRDAIGIRGLVQAIKRRMYQRRLAVILERTKPPPGTIRLLDVGCADGRLLDWYRSGRGGRRIETHGIDMNERAVAIARRRGHRVVFGRFEEDRELEARSFHVILANHVIEHVADPQRFVRRGRELLAPGGLFVIETPNVDSVDARLCGRHWGGCHVPRHWTFYDARTITGLAESVGLRVERIEYQANPIFWNWTFHSWLRERFRESRIADRLFPPVAIFHPSLQSFLLLTTFTATDLLLKILTGKTASMAVEMRDPLA